MNHRVRAKGIVDRAMPSRLIVRDGERTLHVDVIDWKQQLAKGVARGLRAVEREAYRHGVANALDILGEQLRRLRTGELAADTKLLERAIAQGLDLHKRGPAQ